MGQPRIFISYRRDDAAGYARAVSNELAHRFGADSVFIDVDDIHAGQPFGDVIQRSVGGSTVLLALIGKRWLGERDDDAPPRIHDDADFVRREVAAGLAVPGMRVVPVLLDGATMPQPAQLPPELRALTGRNALELDHSRFAADMARLLREVGQALGEEAPAPTTRRELLTWGLAGAALAALVVGAIAWELRSSVREPPTRAPAARPPVNGEWRAQLEYDWPNARYVEHFVFSGDGGALHGKASFLGVARGVLEGRVDSAGLSFVTRTSEAGGAAADAVLVHRYRGRLVGDELRFVLQTEGGSSAHVPVEFVAHRVVASTATGR